MNSMSDETEKLIKEYMGLHGVSIMANFCAALADRGCQIGLPENPGSIWNASIEIEKENPDGEDLKSKFFFNNTFKEILCVDRDDDPLVFDPKILEDGMYIHQKIDEVVNSRLTLIFGMLDGYTIEEIYDDNPGMFERIRKREVDNTDDNEQEK